MCILYFDFCIHYGVLTTKSLVFNYTVDPLYTFHPTPTPLLLWWPLLCSLYFFVFFFLLKKFFLPCHMAHGILVPQPGIKPTPPALEGQSLNHWTAREVPLLCSLYLYVCFCLVWFVSLFCFWFFIFHI